MLNKLFNKIILFLILIPFVFGISIDKVNYDPTFSENYNEYISFYTSENVNLSNFLLCGKKINSGFLKTNGEIIENKGFTVESYGYFVISDGGSGSEVYDNYKFLKNTYFFHTDSSSTCGGLTNTGKEISYTYNNETVTLNYLDLEQKQTIEEENEISLPSLTSVNFEVIKYDDLINFGSQSTVLIKFNSKNYEGKVRFLVYGYPKQIISNYDFETIQANDYENEMIVELDVIKDTNYFVSVPFFTKPNCDNNYADDFYRLRLRAFIKSGEWKEKETIDFTPYFQGKRDLFCGGLKELNQEDTNYTLELVKSQKIINDFEEVLLEKEAVIQRLSKENDDLNNNIALSKNVINNASSEKVLINSNVIKEVEVDLGKNKLKKLINISLVLIFITGIFIFWRRLD